MPDSASANSARRPPGGRPAEQRGVPDHRHRSGPATRSTTRYSTDADHQDDEAADDRRRRAAAEVEIEEGQHVGIEAEQLGRAAGPPPVSVHTMSKVRKASIARITMQTTMTGRSIGRVRWRNTRQVDVPSIAAASNGSRGRLCRPASSSRVNHGVHSQMSVSRMMPKAVQRCDQPGLALEPQPLEHGVHDPELVVEHPAHHDGGDHRRHHQRQQQHGLHELLAAERPVEQQREREAERPARRPRSAT